MALEPGTRIGSYEILRLLGSGGMGEVYRARDLKLNRDVAIKVLPPLFAADPDRLARFEREAQILATLNHPHIAAIYGLETADGVAALVLEFVDGDALDGLIGPAGMPLPDVLRLAIQIADALAVAHASGIVHRDLKPANVMVTAGGAAKLLDFGLAKIAALQGFAATVTAPAPHTEEGAVMGTVAYMSPEQAAGRPLDARSDIFSFGSVLFEMVTGRRAFEGDTSMSTLAAIIHEPARPVSQVNARVPRELERLISRCHRKDQARRVQSMADLRVALEEVREDLEAGRLTTAAGPAAPLTRARRMPLAVAAGAVAIAAAGLLAGRTFFIAEAPAVPSFELHRVTADIGLTNDPAVTPNGTLIAYASDRHNGTTRDIWVQPAAGGEPVRVTTHEADDSAPAFAPDGSRIAFRSERDGGGIYVVPALGGPERLLVPGGRGPQFSPDGTWLAYWTGGRGGETHLFVMPASGGNQRRLFADMGVLGGFVWAPDSRRLLFLGRSRVAGARARVGWWIGDIDEDSGRAPRELDVGRVMDSAVAMVRAWHGDRLLYTLPWGPGAAVNSVRLDSESLTGDVRTVYRTPERLGGLAIDQSGRLHVSSHSARSVISGMPVDGPRPAGEPVPITSTAAGDWLPSLSADGSRLAFLSTRRADTGVWLKDLVSQVEVALPSAADLGGLAPSPDGHSIAYATMIPEPDVFIVDARGGPPRQICSRCANYIWSWAPDGRSVLVNIPSPQGLGLLDVASGQVSRLLDPGEERLWHGRLSPDGQWIAFVTWDAADRTRTVIAPFAGGRIGDRRSWILATDGRHVDEEAAWAPDGRTLYFVSERDGFRCVYAIAFDPGAGRVVGHPEPVVHVHGARQTILPTTERPSRIDVAGGRLVFPMLERQGNIYALTPVER